MGDLKEAVFAQQFIRASAFCHLLWLFSGVSASAKSTLVLSTEKLPFQDGRRQSKSPGEGSCSLVLMLPDSVTLRWLLNLNNLLL